MHACIYTYTHTDTQTHRHTHTHPVLTVALGKGSRFQGSAQTQSLRMGAEVLQA